LRRLLTLCSAMGRSALRGLQSSGVTTTIAVLSVAVVLVLIGSFALVAGNMAGLLERYGREVRVTAYLDDEVTGEARRKLAASIATIEGVQSIEVFSKQQAMERFRDHLGDDLLDGLDENPLPASLLISLHDANRTPEGVALVVSALDGLPGITDLSEGQDWVDGYARATALVRAAGIGLGGVLGLAALLIVASTIRLAVYARRDELEILGLVGAGRAYIRIPFLIEGGLQGALGGLLAVALLFLAFRGILPQIEYGLEAFLGSVDPRFLNLVEVTGVVLGGALLGLLGSMAALVGWRR
jgi:cell division transport system permease protein